MHIFKEAEETTEPGEWGKHSNAAQKHSEKEYNSGPLTVALSCYLISITLTFGPCLFPLEALYASIGHP